MTVFADSFADDLARRVAAIVLDSLPTSAAVSPWFNVDRAADYLDTTPDAIRGMVKRRQLPVHRSSTPSLYANLITVEPNVWHVYCYHLTARAAEPADADLRTDAL